MKNPAQQAQSEQIDTVSLGSALSGSFCNKYFAISVSAVILAAAAFFLGSENVLRIVDIAFAAILGLLMWLIQYLWLRKYGISRKMMLDNRKSVDPRLSGSLGDLNSLGSTMGALAGISVVLSELFIMDGGIYSSGEIAFPLIESFAKALCIGAMISVTTSRPSLRCSLYIITGRTTGAKGKELLKKTCRASNSPELMSRLRKMSCVRTTAAIVVAVIIVISALSGAGSAFTCAQCAFLCMLAVGLSGCCSPQGGDEKHSDEKIPLLDKSSRRRCVLNSFTVIIIAFFFIFSFPFRSVYTEYTSTGEFYYDDEVSYDIDIFSVPQPDEREPLFNGLFLSVGLMIAVVSGAYALSDGFSSVSQISSELIGGGLTVGAAVIYGIIQNNAVLDAVQYLVAGSLACLLIMVDLIAYLAGKGRAKI